MTFIIIFLSVIIVPAILIFLYLTITEYKPNEIEEAIIYRKSKDKNWDGNLKVTTFNIGYCGMDMQQRKTSNKIKLSKHYKREHTFDNLISIASTIKDENSDFYLLQEVDHDSARSSKINQIEHLTSDLVNYNSSFTYNYKAKYVPFPMNNPVGATNSGLLNLSKFRFTKSERYQLEGHEKYPKSIFFLKRCMLINEYDLPRNKKLYMINIHFSSYDKNKLFRTAQFDDMFEYVSRLYDGKKNYIIVGGDFNYLMDKSKFNENTPEWLNVLPVSLKESKFKPIFDSKIATMKGNDDSEHIIDGFIVSPNIKVTKCETRNERFEHSNHNPVTMTFKL